MSLNGKTDRPRERIGIFGGTFDPPHIGHLILAMEACDQLGLDKFLWVLTASPPHKQDQEITPVEQRMALVQAAIEDDTRFVLSRIEIDRPGPHYAAETMRLLAVQFPHAALCYLIGGDSLRDLPRWYKPDVILDHCECLGVMRRPGDEIDRDQLEQELPGVQSRIRFIHTPMLEISSTDIRERIKTGRSFRYYLPEKVYKLIMEHEIYHALFKKN